jgi:hypothetical protein
MMVAERASGSAETVERRETASFKKGPGGRGGTAMNPATGGSETQTTIEVLTQRLNLGLAG